MGIKDLKKDYIIQIAAGLFLDSSVSEITIKDIAERAGVGEATVYRYFSGKKNIVVLSGVYLQDKVFRGFYGLKGETGYEKLKAFYDAYLKIFNENREYYKFINEFDAFIINEGSESMEEYETGLDNFRNEFMKAYAVGLKDKSVKEITDVNVFYYATTHAVLGLCKKLAYGKDVVKQDGSTDKSEEIKTLIDVILCSIKNN